MMKYLLLIIVFIFIVFFFVFPRYSATILILLLLIKFFGFINFGNSFLIPVVPGISLNVLDICTFAMIPVWLFSDERKNISSGVLVPIYALFICVFLITLMSMFALDASLSLIGNRLRAYSLYILIPPLICILCRKEKLYFFITAICILGVIGCLIHFAEFIRGKAFIINGLQAVDTYTKERWVDGEMASISRYWNRAVMYVLFSFCVSLSLLLSKYKKKIVFILILAISASSMFISFTRTSYIFLITSTSAIFILYFLRRKGGSILPFLSIVIVSLLILVSAIKLTGRSDVGNAVSDRFLSIGTAISGKNTKSTWAARMDQIRWLIKEAKNASFPPILGLGISNQTVEMVTLDVGFINILVNLGLYGLMFMIFWFFYFYRKAFYLFRHVDDEFLSAIAGAMIGCITGMLFTIINFDYFTSNKTYLLIIVTVSIEVISIIHRREASKSTTAR